MKAKALFLVLTIVFLLACGVSSEQMTATAVVAKAQTQTAAPTLTATVTLTPKPTATPKPTETLEPTETPIPEPAVVGDTVTYRNLEITLLGVVTHTQIMLSSGSGYDANDGYIFVDVTFLVRNTDGAPTGVRLEDIYVVEENNDAWYPFYGGIQTVEIDKRFNPMASIKLNEINGKDTIQFKKDTYLRLIWTVHEHQDLLFGIDESPQFTFTLD